MKKTTQISSFILFLIILLVDFFSKRYVATNFILGEEHNIIPGLFSLTYVLNKGAAFGIFSGMEEPYRSIFLHGFTIVALLGILFFLKNEVKGDKISYFALSMVLSGAVGNIIDRLAYGAVVDFLDFHIKDYHWPAFNVADSAICVGVFVLLIRMTFNNKEKALEVSND